MINNYLIKKTEKKNGKNKLYNNKHFKKNSQIMKIYNLY